MTVLMFPPPNSTMMMNMKWLTSLTLNSSLFIIRHDCKDDDDDDNDDDDNDDDDEFKVIHIELTFYQDAFTLNFFF